MNEEKQIEEMALILKDVPPIEFPVGSRMQGKHIYSLKKFAEALYNADYRKQEWISVDERLPQKSGDYLTYHEHRSCGVLYYNADIKLWNVYYSDDVRNAIRSITHWMPLPKAPKMKGGAE